MNRAGGADLPRLSARRLVGRDGELDVLAHALARPPALAIVEGEAGVGKSRLVREALASPALAGRTVLVGCCHPLREPFPLGPLLEAVRAVDLRLPAALNPVTGALRGLLPELAPRLPAAPPPLADPRAERHRLVRATIALLEAAGPAVLVLEDLHWADETTLELLRLLLAAELPRLAVVLTVRPEELADHAALATLGRPPAGTVAVRLTLAPLDADGVDELVREILDAEEVSPGFRGYLHRRTAGLPFAVEEVLRLLLERRDLVRRDGRWARQVLDRLAVPAAVRDSVRERVALLSPPARAAVEVLAVLGRAGADDLVAAAAELDMAAAREGLAEGLRRGLLVEAGTATALRHDLARQAVVEDLPAPRRRALHAAVAAALEALDPLPVAQLAHHHGQAGNAARAAVHAEAAADRAAAHGDDAAVCRFLQQALAAGAVDRPARVRLARRLAQSALHAFDHAEAAAVVRRILDTEPLERGDRGELRRHLGILLAQAGDASAGVAEMARAVPDLADRPVVAARTMLSLAAPWVVEGTAEEHRRWLLRGLAAVPQDSGPADRIAVVVDEATALTSLADPRAASVEAALPADAGTEVERRALQRGCLNLALACAAVGAHARADDWLARALGLAERTPSELHAALHRTTAVVLDFYAGRWDGLAERADALARSMADVPHAAVDTEAVGGLVALARGHTAAVDRLHPLLARARRAGSLPVLAMVAGGLAGAHLAVGRTAAAAEVAAIALDVLVAKELWGWCGDVAPPAVRALVAEGDAAAATALVDRMAAGVGRLDAPAAAAAVRECQAVLLAAAGAHEQAAAAFGDAAAAWRALPRPVPAVRAAVGRACSLLAGGDPAGAQVGLSAVEALRPLGADGEAAAARRLLRAAGADVPYRWRGGRRGLGDELSPREEEVVALVADGLTNREIAAALHLSPRTVEYHVARALRKLQLPSRRALVRLPPRDRQA